MKLRSTFLLSLVLVVGALTCSTLLVVRHTFQAQVRSSLAGNLRNSAQTFTKFQQAREYTLTRVTEFVAADPSLRSAMAGKHRKTVQHMRSHLSTFARSCLLLISDRRGRVVAMQTEDANISRSTAEDWLRFASLHGQQKQWQYASGELFQVFNEPVYFGKPSPAHLVGFLTLAYGINESIVHRMSEISDSQVIVLYGDQLAATNVAPSAISSCSGCFLPNPTDRSDGSVHDLYLGGEHYLSTSISLVADPVPVRLVILKSLDNANKALAPINRTLVMLGLASVAAGCVIVFAISRHFAQPLEQLLAGVRALAHQDFRYPLQNRGRGEFAELTGAFESMRSSLVETQQQLLQAEQLATIGRTAGSLSHDLRHRLTAILANSEFLLDEESLPRRELLYTGIHHAVMQMTELLDALLEFAKSPESRHCTFVDLRSIIEDSIAAIRFDPSFQQVRISCVCEKEIKAWFDGKRLRRAFYNLLFNACEAVSPTQGEVVISSVQVGNSAEVRITDNGPGIPEKVRKSLFQPFNTSGKQNGTGLGMAVAQKCCRDHGGKVELVESRPGQTTFKIVLPLSGFYRKRNGDDDPEMLCAGETKADIGGLYDLQSVRTNLGSSLELPEYE